MLVKNDRPPGHHRGGISLQDLERGVPASVVALDLQPAELRRLLSLGIRVGRSVEVTHHRAGSVVVAADGGRVALGADIARSIVVESGAR